MITIEYLLPFDTKDGICKDIPSFKSVITSNSSFKISNNQIQFNRSNYTFSVKQSDVEDQNCSVFHVTFETGRTTEKFREMLNVFRKTIGVHLQDKIQIVWDGISFEWSKELYPKIYQIENSMRKLISKFMLTKLGIGWHNDSVPKDVKESIKDSSYKQSHSILYEVDFIQLSNFLFKDYALKKSENLPKLLSKVIEGEINDNEKKEILAHIPKNNWDRYFSNLVKLESDQFKKKWEQLYQIRIKVAHNKSMKIEDYKKGTSLCDELEKIINSALNKIDNIEIPNEEKENISLQTIGTLNQKTEKFVTDYLKFNDSLIDGLSLYSDKYKNFGLITDPISSLKNSDEIIGYNTEFKSELSKILGYKDLLTSGEAFPSIYGLDIDSSIFNSAIKNFKFDLEHNKIDLEKLNTSLVESTSLKGIDKFPPEILFPKKEDEEGE
ncbi:HEPN domain-containing protein [Algoriphagus sp. PAP.12]|uniref:HEPN domain-containing protein n=1 Tax=Algoriphagus sp. PAP.12 TaxID=2996678 RepID=UPI00227CBECA|nr:HEPN domain-containing protein [Algoriphagus sp. PAP.12]